MVKRDERYSAPDYGCGIEPNDYLVSVVDHIPRGRVLCLGEGEGRDNPPVAGNVRAAPWS